MPRRRRSLAGDVVIVIPGFAGSTLARDGRVIWGASLGTLFRTFSTLGSSISGLTLDGDDPDLDLGDGVVATGLLGE